MRPLSAEFLPRQPVRPGWWIALIAALLLLTVDQGWRARQTQQQTRITAEQNAQLLQRLNELQRAHLDHEARARIKLPYQQDAMQVVKMAGFPLQRVFGAIEATQVPGIRVSALELNTVQGVVKLELAFSDHDALLTYLDEINRGEEPARWTLVQAQIGSSAGVPGVAILTSTWSATDR